MQGVHNSCQSPGSQPAQGQSPTPNTANLHKSTYPSERKELTGKAGGEPCCLSVSEPDVCVVAGDRCLPTNCTHRPNGPTLPSAHPHSQAVRWLSSLLGHGTAARRPGQSPRAVTVPRAWGWQGQPSSSRNSWQLHTAQWSQICAIPHLPSTTGKSWPWIFIMIKPEGDENPCARAELVLSMNRTQVWDAASYSDSKMSFVRGNSPGNTETQPEEMGSWSSSALATMILKGCQNTRLGLFLLWRESNISHNSLQHLCACSPK